MEHIYSWFANLAHLGLLPEIFKHSFMARGLLASLLIGPVLGGLGTVVVAKKLSFFRSYNSSTKSSCSWQSTCNLKFSNLSSNS